MIKKSQLITYQTDPNVKSASLFNCRRRDLHDGPGITTGTIVQGMHGFVAAEANVPKVGGKTVAFVPNGKCKWKGKVLDCLHLPGTPKGSDLACMNYVVAEIPDPETEALVQSSELPVILLADGKKVVNLECDRFAKQTPERRATFLPPEAK